MTTCWTYTCAQVRGWWCMPGRGRSPRWCCRSCEADTAPRCTPTRGCYTACSSGHIYPSYNDNINQSQPPLQKHQNKLLRVKWLSEVLTYSRSEPTLWVRCLPTVGLSLPCEKHCYVVMVGVVLVLHVDCRLPFAKTVQWFVSMVGYSKIFLN